MGIQRTGKKNITPGLTSLLKSLPRTDGSEPLYYITGRLDYSWSLPGQLRKPIVLPSLKVKICALHDDISWNWEGNSNYPSSDVV